MGDQSQQTPGLTAPALYHMCGFGETWRTEPLKVLPSCPIPKVSGDGSTPQVQNPLPCRGYLLAKEDLNNPRMAQMDARTVAVAPSLWEGRAGFPAASSELLSE